MIRRPTPTHFELITQHDHALFAGELSRRLGNATFSTPSPNGLTVEAIAHHDAGWPLHDDDNPTLNSENLPLHVVEVPTPLATQVWSASVARAMNLGDYQGLLVSLHVLGLSAFGLAHLKDGSRADLFEINKFQHRQVEIQVDLLKRLHLRTDVPLHLGLAKPGTSPADDQLLFNFRLLTAMDRVSLSLCTGQLLFPKIEDVHPHPGQPPLPITLQMPDPATMTRDPWPFDHPEMLFEVPARRVPKDPFPSLEAFQSAYRATTPEPLRLTLRCSS
jgi:hypothetical protein